MGKKLKINRNDNTIEVLQSMTQEGCVSSFEGIYSQCEYTKKHSSSPKYEKILVNWGDTFMIYGVLTKEATAKNIEDEERLELDKLSKLFDPMYDYKPKEPVEAKEPEEPYKRKWFGGSILQFMKRKSKYSGGKIGL